MHQGIKVISVGFFVERDGAVVWRGPMVHKLLQQFLEDVEWGELDYLVVDLPPGTGDAQLSLSQLIPITGAVMVTTPQEVAIIDVVKAISMFKKVEIPILGVVENMSYYVCPACGHHDEIFARGGGKRLAQEVGTPFLGEIPIDAKVRYGGDSGRPVVVGAPGVGARQDLHADRGQGRGRDRQAQRSGRRHGPARAGAGADSMSEPLKVDAGAAARGSRRTSARSASAATAASRARRCRARTPTRARYVAERMRAAGLEVRHDEVGNLRAPAAHGRRDVGVARAGGHDRLAPRLGAVGRQARRAARRRRRDCAVEALDARGRADASGRSRSRCSSARRARAFRAAPSARRRCPGTSRSRACWRSSIPTASRRRRRGGRRSLTERRE